MASAAEMFISSAYPLRMCSAFGFKLCTADIVEWDKRQFFGPKFWAGNEKESGFKGPNIAV